MNRRNVVSLVGAVLVVLGVGTGVAACGGDSGSAGEATGPAQGDQTLVIGVRDDPTAGGFDPDFGGGSDVQNELGKNMAGQWVQYARVPTDEGYMAVDPTEFDPDLLESWEMAPDNLSVDMKLRETLKNHQGQALTTEDMSCWLDRAFEANAGSAWDFQTGGVPDKSHFEITGPYTFTISFPKPAPLFFPLMRDQSVTLLSCDWQEHASEDDPLAKLYLAQNDLRPGEYKAISQVAGTQLELGWDSSYPGPKPYFTKVMLKSIPSSSDRALLLRQGEIDIAQGLSGDELESLEGVPGVKVWSIPSRAQMVLGMTNSRKPFDDVGVRQAIAHAIPYDEILNGVYNGNAQISTTGPVPRESVWQTGIEWPYSYDPEKAKALLAESGYANGLEFTIGIDAGKAQQETAAVLIQSELENVGVEATIVKDPDAVYNDKKFNGTYDAWIDDGWNAFVDNPYYYLFIFYRSGIYCCNFMHYENSEVDRINDTLANTVDEATTKQLWQQAVEQIVEDVPVAFILDLNWQIAARDDITGIVAEPDSLLSYRDLRRE